MEVRKRVYNIVREIKEVYKQGYIFPYSLVSSVDLTVVGWYVSRLQKRRYTRVN